MEHRYKEMRKILMTLVTIVMGASSSFAAMSFGEWVTKLIDQNCWTVGELPKLEASTKSGMSSSVASTKYKSAIQHAIVTLAKTMENETVKSTVKSFGFKLDLDSPIEYGGTFNASGAPTFNNAVDKLLPIEKTAIESALSDLDTIPSTWTGSVMFTTSELKFLDDNVAIDYGDVLSLKACLKAALGALYMMKGYDCNINYSEYSKRFTYDIPNVAKSKEGSLEDGTAWDRIPYLEQYEGYLNSELPLFGYKKSDAPFKIARCGDTIWLYFKKPSNMIWEWICVKLATDSDSEGDNFDVYGDSRYQSTETYIVYKIDLNELDSMDITGTVKLKYIDYGYYDGEDSHNDQSVDNCNRYLAYLFAGEPGLGASVRDAAALNTAKTHIKAAIDLALKADAKIVARKDLAFHFFDYDCDSAEQKEAREVTITQFKKVLESLNGNKAVDFDLSRMLTAEERSDMNLSTSEKVNFNKLFTGEITRKLMPPSNSSTCYSSSIDKIPDPTFAGLLPSMTKSRISSMVSSYRDSQDKYYIFFEADESYGWMSGKKYKMKGVYKLPPCELQNWYGREFTGWKCEQNGKIYDDEALIFNLTTEKDAELWFRAIWK